MRLKQSLPFLILLLCIVHCYGKRGRSRNEKRTEENNRDGKLFSLFTVVNFKNEACVSTSSLSTGSTTYRNGTCFTSSECSSKGGSAKGKCAAGFGVCCVFTLSDSTSTTVNYNDTYIQNPDFPSAYGSTSTLSYTVNKCSNDVCWLRLDFEDFTTAGPSLTDETSGGVCVDSFTVTVNTGQTIPAICGQNTGQHIYVDVGSGSSDTATIQMSFGTSTTVSRKWDIKVAQIPCGKNYAPPSGCLQWHTGLTGQITTFNFLNSAGTHLASQNYNACIRQESGFCCVQYQVCSDPNSYSLDNQLDSSIAANAKAVVGTSCVTKATAPDTTSTADYIEIASSSAECNGNVVEFSRYCGSQLNTDTTPTQSIPICQCAMPFAVGIVTDAFQDTKSDTVVNRGLCLDWSQVPCTN